MRRSVIHRLVVAAVMATTLGGLSAPAVASTKPTKALAAALTKGEVYTPAAAHHRVKKLFFLVRLPAHALLQKGTQAPGTPSPDSLDADLFTASLGHWWLTAGTVSSVTKWLAKHPPVGFSVMASGAEQGRKTLVFQPISAKAGCCSTLEATVSKQGKQTAINMASFVQWQPRRAGAEHIPVSVTDALLEVGSDPTQTIPSFPNTSRVVSGDGLLSLISTLNTLAATRAQPVPCPYTPNWSKATFRYGGHVVVFASPSACPYVDVTIGGRSSTTLAGNITDLIASILGVTTVSPAM